MKNTSRQLGLFQLVLLVVMLFGCASAADDATLPPSAEATTSSSLALDGAAMNEGIVLDAESGDCDLSALPGTSADYEELASILETSSLDETAPEAAASTCRRVCRCCRNGNRFCCSHCRFCSGPIGPYGLSSEVLAR